MRQAGKTTLAKQAIEAALKEGKTVAVCSLAGTTVYRRKKHLTSIEVHRREKTTELL